MVSANQSNSGPSYSGGGPGGGGGGRGHGQRRGGEGRRGGRNQEQKPASDLTEKVVFINRCAKVVKGGRRFSFSALVVVGNRAGKVGYGFGKANEVSEAIRKAGEAARKSMLTVSIFEDTIPHDVIGEYGGGRVLLRPATPGTGVIAGGGVRAVVEAAGVKNVLAKSLGSSNHANVVKATLEALLALRSPEEAMRIRGMKFRARRREESPATPASSTPSASAVVEAGEVAIA